MTLLQRRHRAVYRVYSEDEYLAGVDPFADWDAPMVELTEVAAPELREVAAPELTEMTVHIAGQYCAAGHTGSNGGGGHLAGAQTAPARGGCRADRCGGRRSV